QTRNLLNALIHKYHRAAYPRIPASATPAVLSSNTRANSRRRPLPQGDAHAARAAAENDGTSREQPGSENCVHLPNVTVNGQHRLDDPVVAGAAAQVPRQRDAEVGLRRPRVRLQQRGRGDQHPGCAEAALDASVLEERRLEWAQLAVVGEPFDRRDLVPLGL